MPVSDRLHVELWTSWASLLRSYAAAHGLHAAQHAVVEVSHEAILLRVGARWLRFTHRTVEGTHQTSLPFQLYENGTASAGDMPPEEMDLAAERFARELLLHG